jgi:hypothetical protein
MSCVSPIPTQNDLAISPELAILAALRVSIELAAETLRVVHPVDQPPALPRRRCPQRRDHRLPGRGPPSRRRRLRAAHGWPARLAVAPSVAVDIATRSSPRAPAPALHHPLATPQAAAVGDPVRFPAVPRAHQHPRRTTAIPCGTSAARASTSGRSLSKDRAASLTRQRRDESPSVPGGHRHTDTDR